MLLLGTITLRFGRLFGKTRPIRTIVKVLLRRAAFFLLGGGLLFLGCISDDMPAPALPTAGPDYFPLSVNRYAIYDVEDIRYTLRDGADTSRYQLREWVADSLIGEGGEIIYSLLRYTRNSVADQWQLDSIWTARKNQARVVVVENNVPFLKLVFPFQEGLQWDGNLLNSTWPQTYTLTATDTTLRREIGTDLDSLLDNSQTVIQRDLQTLVNDSVLLETYGEQVGLIFKKSLILQYCADEDCIGQQKIESGRSYRQTLVAYGKEQ